MLAEPLNSDRRSDDDRGGDMGLSRLKRADGRPVEWVVTTGYVPYPEAVAEM